MNIRKATISDLDTLLKFGKQLYLVEKQYEPLLEYSQSESKERYINQLSNNLALFLIAENELQPVGYLYAHAEKISPNQDLLECDVEVIYISPEFRGQGLSKRLLNYCIQWSKEKNIKTLKTEIFAQNNHSIKAFENIGFKPYCLTYSLYL